MRLYEVIDSAAGAACADVVRLRMGRWSGVRLYLPSGTSRVVADGDVPDRRVRGRGRPPEEDHVLFDWLRDLVAALAAGGCPAPWRAAAEIVRPFEGSHVVL